MVAVIFDLDGTLIDSAIDIHAGSVVFLAELGRPPLPLQTIKSFVGHGVTRLVERIAAASGLPQPTDELEKRFLRHYHSADSRLYPGVLTALEVLATAGCAIGLCTNKPHGPTHEVLLQLGIAPIFKTIITGDSLPTRKPDPAPLLAAVHALRQDHAVFVGDSEVDAQTAVNAALPFLLYTGGYRKAAVQDIPHTAAFAHHSDLPALIANMVL